ncbi:hypothetical protein HGG72_08180 [Ochrobactrum pecoris]|uniref:DNA-binding XRE family transcriptional regulator n=1 Tax=Brucella pecoris TaxID=867683 RepID=A0A5C5CRR6_9HYPH|nr:hypothetical protein [Brucella pecoris]KAB2699384.1 hypothetical protein F9K79_09835 [Ochrobactrum sp. Kaboul]MCH4539124.1 hypothetical protein [Ochrobactrum sp. A-1]MBB4092403.1 DNA-binding XRE family transcriptional regulator [Brucella pecoris]NKW80317.1 hypothetical protein [Brucella pecoris]TNV14252.1 hypothetical protein FIB18_03155 [Brucella pecoris]
MRDNTTKFHDILTRYKQVMAEVEQLTLTGRQIKFVRNELGESQMAFAKRIGSTQVSVFRAEEKDGKLCTGLIVLTCLAAAEELGFDIPSDETLRDPVGE